MSADEFLFPRFNYYLDESDPDVVILRRSDDSFAAAFSARGVTRKGIIEAAKDDYRELLSVYRARQGKSTDQGKSIDLEDGEIDVYVESASRLSV